MRNKSTALAIFLACIGASVSPAQNQSQTFDFTNKPTAQGLQEIATIIRTVGSIHYVTVDSAAATLTVTGTSDELTMSGWMIHALDQPAPPATTAPSQQYLVAGKSDDVIRVFHLNTVPTASAQPINEILTVLRTVGDIQKVYNDTALADLVVRGPAAQISFAEFVINALDVTPGSTTATKEFDMQDPYQGAQQVKVFYLAHASTPQSVQELLTTLRTVADIQKVFNYTQLNALVIRAVPTDMAASEWLIQSLDIASAPASSGAPNAHEYQMAGYGRMAPTVISVYYPANLTTPKGLNETLTALRTDLYIQKTFDYSTPAALVVRGSADVVAKAEQLMQTRDQASKGTP